MHRDRDLTRTVRRRLDMLVSAPGGASGTGWIPMLDGGAAREPVGPTAPPPGPTGRSALEPAQPIALPARLATAAPEPALPPTSPLVGTAEAPVAVDSPHLSSPSGESLEWPAKAPIPPSFAPVAPPLGIVWAPLPVPAGLEPDLPTRSQAALRVAADAYTASHGSGLSSHPRRRVRWSVPWRLVGIAGAAVLLLAGGVALRAASAAPGAPVALPVPAPDGTPTAKETSGTAVVVVDVVGAVGVPGVVRLPAGSRVVDAVAAAGGPSADADVGTLNLARLLVDGEQIVVPRQGQDATVGGGPQESSDPRVDLNTADVAALDALPGIGPVLAQRIVAHRDDGPYTSVDDLGDVSGIGPTLLDRLRELVRV